MLNEQAFFVLQGSKLAKLLDTYVLLSTYVAGTNLSVRWSLGLRVFVSFSYTLVKVTEW